MESVDRKIIQLLSKGYKTQEISTYFIEKGIAPSSVSSVEKRIKALKKVYGAKTLFHLAVLVNKEKSIK
jgi:transposase-like protein